MINENQTAKYKAAEYLYDLSNAASENGFKSDEHWEVNPHNEDGKKVLEKLMKGKK